MGGYSTGGDGGKFPLKFESEGSKQIRGKFEENAKILSFSQSRTIITDFL